MPLSLKRWLFERLTEMFGHRGVAVSRLPIISSFFFVSPCYWVFFGRSQIYRKCSFSLSPFFSMGRGYQKERSAEGTKRGRWRQERRWTFHFAFVTFFPLGLTSLRSWYIGSFSEENICWDLRLGLETCCTRLFYQSTMW